MKILRTALLGVALAGMALTGWAGTTLSIRLVEASPRAAGPTPGLEDVAGILARNLPFTSFTLQGSQTLSLPAGGSVSLAGFSVACTGTQQQLQVAVKRDGRVLISTILRLQDGTPVILGGFQSENGKQILVFVAR